MKPKFARGNVVGWSLVVVGLGVGVACGPRFRNGDCRVTHTCDPSPETSTAGGATNAGATAPSAAGGVGRDGGEGGAGAPSVECSVASDCTDDSTGGVSACVDGRCVKANLAPAVVSVSPADHAVEVDPGSRVVIQLSEELDASTVTSANVTLFDGERAIGAKLSYTNGEITLTPDRLLPLLASVRVVLGRAVTDVDGVGLVEPFSSTFVVRDGAWAASPSTVTASVIASVAPTLQLDDDDRALVAWIANGLTPCPTKAAWYQRGALSGAAQTFSVGRNRFCSAVRSSVSADGIGLLTWYEEGSGENGIAGATYRSGKWSSASIINDRSDSFSGAVAADDTGLVHYISPGSDVQAWTTTSDGKWPTMGAVLAPRRAAGDVRIAVAANGDAVAAWRDVVDETSTQIAVSRYSAATKSWTVAEMLPCTSSADDDCGEPQVAFGPADEPFIAWQINSEIVAARFLASAWSEPKVVSGRSMIGPPALGSIDPPGLAFDGTTMVATYVRLSGKARLTHVSRYDAELDAWTPSESLNDLPTRALVARMSQIHADRRGNLLVVWPVAGGASETFALAFRRYDAQTGAWGAPGLIPGAAFSKSDYGLGHAAFALGGNSRGAAAVMFANLDSGGLSNLRLASFY